MDMAIVYWTELTSKLSILPPGATASQTQTLLAENALRFHEIKSSMSLLNQLCDLFDLIGEPEKQIKTLKIIAELYSKVLANEPDAKYSLVVTQVNLFLFIADIFS